MHPHPAPADSAGLLRPLKRYRSRLERKVRALEADLAAALRAPELRRQGEALLSYLKRVPPRADRVDLPDPAQPERTIRIELLPRLSPQANAARLFKRAAKAERGQAQIAERLKSTRAELEELSPLLERAASGETPQETLRADLERWLERVPWALRGRPRLGAKSLPATLGGAQSPSRDAPSRARPPGAALGAEVRRAPSARLMPRRLVTVEGWHVLVGRSNEGNDYLTHGLARPEDYWFHAQGVSGSHVVLRRGKGKNEPSKRTLEEVASWAAFYSKARTAGKVPVIFTRKKHVRRPRKAPPGTALCSHEKTLVVRPVEPPRGAWAEGAEK